MIKDISRRSSIKIARGLNIRLQRENNALEFTKDAGNIVALLDMTQASVCIVRRMKNDPALGHELRWIRDTDQNKRILESYLIKRIITHTLGLSENLHYTSCCNCFSQKKPKEEQGHKKVISDCLILLLGKEQKARAITFRKQLRRQNKSKKEAELRGIFKLEFLNYFQKESRLNSLRIFIEDLPKKDGCFQFPLIKWKPFPTCPGPCPQLKTSKPLRFKVDLFTHDPYIKQRIASSLFQKPDPIQPKSTPTKFLQKRSNETQIDSSKGKAKKRESKSFSSESSCDGPPPIFVESEYSGDEPEVKEEPESSQPCSQRSSDDLETETQFWDEDEEDADKFSPWKKSPVSPDQHLQGTLRAEENELSRLVCQVDQLNLSNDSEREEDRIISQATKCELQKPKKLTQIQFKEDSVGINERSSGDMPQAQVKKARIQMMNLKLAKEKEIKRLREKIRKNKEENQQLRGHMEDVEAEMNLIKQKILSSAMKNHIRRKRAGKSYFGHK